MTLIWKDAIATVSTGPPGRLIARSPIRYVLRGPEPWQSTTIETPPKKKKFEIATWIAIVSVVIALASAVVAILAAIFSHQQANAANQQNTINEQQQLLTLTTTIAQQLDQAQPSTSNGQIAWTETLTLNGEAAQVVITKLGGDGVTGVEYDEVARALGTGVDPAKAIASTRMQ